ncbi:23S rRNA (guanosine(2251)-2'-O)-methyltransferase RlmB [Chitinivibrio alkaliphilus]|uniref:SpoU rRNA methylase n=1 Tax=Chitinivibrio alkaliphilus ACht1 TaxID=1313304 RepID=U7DA73_9BACT|nr:23S rRNA (guanosine(2251)-2'-O)-methyltransferase RlmB [Chitinivibrio alkaliphilus]ERP39289.1 SpoU rRNA methylase [Chitinivibrio alkaliphilus ACht1]
MQKKKEINQPERQVFGIHAVTELVHGSPQTIDKIYFTDKNKQGALFSLMKRVKKEKLPYANIPATKLDKMVPRGSHQGVVAYKTVRSYDPESTIEDILEKEETPLFLVPASLEDPGNFGAIIRTATAFGVSAILLERKGTVGLNGTAAKTSAGTIDHMRIIKPAHLLKTLELLQQAGVQIVGAESGGETRIDQINLSKPTVLITGGEHRGIPPYLQKICNSRLSIPMDPKVESLNVSVAASLLLYERSRQMNFPCA